MASFNRRNHNLLPEVASEERYFVITLTNYPHLLQRTRLLQVFPQQVVKTKSKNMNNSLN